MMLIRQCCVCKRIWVIDHWEHPSSAMMEVLQKSKDISHCYCDDCFRIEIEHINYQRSRAPDALPTSAD